MAEDRKFAFIHGKFVNRVSGEAIPDDEPVIIFRARDRNALDMLVFYRSLCEDAHHRKAIQERIDEFLHFALTHSDRMKEPGITHHIELHSSRRHPFLEPENLHQGRRHERPIEHRVSSLEFRTSSLEKEMKTTMADIDELNTILQGIASDAATLGDDFKNLEAELQAAQEAAANNQPIDLTNAILVARNAQAALDAIVASAAPAAPVDTSGSGDAAPVDTSGSGDAAPVDTSGAGGDASGGDVIAPPPPPSDQDGAIGGTE